MYRVLMSGLLWLAIIFCVNGELLTKWDWMDGTGNDISFRGKGRIQELDGKKYLTAEDGYDFSAIFFNLVDSGLKLSCRGMSLPDKVNASIGAIVFRWENNSWKPLKNMGWKCVLPFQTMKELVFAARKDELGANSGRYMVILYRNSGRPALAEIRLEKLAEDDPAYDATRMNTEIKIAPADARKYEYNKGQGDTMTLTYFPMGVYLYGDSVRDADELRASFAEMRLAGINTVHYAADIGVRQSLPQYTLKVGEIASEYGLRLWVQMNDVYYRNDGSKDLVSLNLNSGMDYVKKYVMPRLQKDLPAYQKCPGIYAWSPSEENPPNSVEPLAEYRKQIWKIVPEQRIFELFTNLKTLQQLKMPWPNIAGVDRYPFMYSARGMASRLWLPGDGLKWYAGAIRPFMHQAQQMGLPMIATIQGSQIYTFYSPEEMCPGATDPKFLADYSIEAAPGMKYYPKFNKFGRWSMYNPCRNGIRAQAWTAVAEGAKGILIYAYSVQSRQTQMEKAFEQIRAGGAVRTVSLCSTHPNWEDMKKVFAELKPWGKLLLALEKLPDAAVTAKNPAIICNSFRDSKDRKFAIMVNTRIVEPGTLKPTIDDNGELANMEQAKPLTFAIEAKEPVFDMETGKSVQSMTLEPGQGRILLIGDKEKPAVVGDEYKQRITN